MFAHTISYITGSWHGTLAWYERSSDGTVYLLWKGLLAISAYMETPAQYHL